ncbi:hypothetical protein NSA47_00885 [Irregularibacter muris]|uniref:Uncharacterized protein n=1 Tax=Irregularibacter muris TaxID=1796619 RepID=A0AAE3HDP7_9FIRM|nr:hypothetical protein [Irregularibacter muris]MCR1897545.1 hypothetical protein [Irregularibacter muris]
MKKSKTLKIVAGTVGILLILAILFITNAFVGNPLSAMMANRAAQRYIDQHYASLDLELDKATYNFKDGMYMIRAKSTTSIDTHFSIYYARGKVQRDDYENYVLDGFNTWERLSKEYSHLAKEIISKELGYEDNNTMVIYDMDEHGNYSNLLELDMKFDKSLPIDAEVTLRLELQNHSLEEITKIVTKAHKAFVNAGCHFNKYGLFSESNNTMIMIGEITPEDIEGGQLLDLLKEAHKHQEDENYKGDITVVIRKIK